MKISEINKIKCHDLQVQGVIVDDDEGVLLRDLQTVLCTDNTNGIRFKRFEKAVNEEVTKLEAELGGTEMKRMEKLCDVFEILKSQEIAEEEEDIYAGDDVDDDHLAFDALDISRMYEELNVTQLVAARKVRVVCVCVHAYHSKAFSLTD